METDETDKKIEEAVKAAIERHRKLGEGVVIWEEEKPKVIPANQIDKSAD